ncbi:tail fiber protein [Xenorhabdus stockiae]|uniref:tail fiber protein n=1 Tax=Xenorhabdus stockiae TaxID=351614 RepID=UPI004062DA3B
MQDKKPDVPVSDESNLVIVATPEYVKEAIAEHAASRNHPDATLQDKGFVVLSNDVSGSETMAATPKAVKEAYDFASTANQHASNANSNANTRLSKGQNGADIPDKSTFVKNIGLQETMELAENALSKFANGTDIQNKTAFGLNLGLLSAAYRAVGTGINQIPDMSAFKYEVDGHAGYVQLPNGIRIQWVRTAYDIPAGSASHAEWRYPFSKECFFAMATPFAFGPSPSTVNIVAGAASCRAVELYSWGGFPAPAQVIGIGI